MKKLIALVLFLLLLVGVSFYINTKSKYVFFPTASVIGTTPTVSAAQNSPQGQNVQITWQIKNKKIVTGPTQITVSPNSLLILAVTSDSNDTLHIDEYNKNLTLLKNAQVLLSFPASVPGNFSIFLNSNSTPIATLTVSQ